MDIEFDAASVRTDIALVLCSDGLVDLYEEHDTNEARYLAQWAAQIGDALVRAGRLPSASVSNSVDIDVDANVSEDDRSDVPQLERQEQEQQQQRNGSTAVNLAVHLLREAIGGADMERASANLTVEMDERWMDDTTIIVHRFS